MVKPSFRMLEFLICTSILDVSFPNSFRTKIKNFKSRIFLRYYLSFTGIIFYLPLSNLLPSFLKVRLTNHKNRHSLRSLSISLSPAIAQWEKPPWSAEPRFELGLAQQLADANWLTPHPTELRRILPSCAAPSRATLHSAELRHTLLSITASYWAMPRPNWATTHPTELRWYS